MDADFTPAPNKTAVAFLANKKPVSSKIFYGLLPELRARAFTIAGIQGANLLQDARDAVAAVAAGSQTWDEAKADIANQLEPYLGEEGSQAKAELVLRVNGYQAFSTSLYQTAQADDDTTHLQYLHGECKVPTPSHQALNGIILPKDDPFWQTHTGPWGHLGCVCYFRPMNPDLVADERDADVKRAPDNKNVIEGAAQRQLQHGDIIRDGVHYNISPNGPDNTGFTWHPEDLRIPLDQLEAKYDPDTWSDFQEWAQKTKLDGGSATGQGQTVWDWLNGSSPSGGGTAPTPTRRKSTSALPRRPAAPAVPQKPAAQGIVEDALRAAKLSPALAEAGRLPPKAMEKIAGVKFGRDSSAYYMPSTDTIYLGRDSTKYMGCPSAFRHEAGHAYHFRTGLITQISSPPEWDNAMRNDMQHFEQNAERNFGPDWRRLFSSMDPIQATEIIAKKMGINKTFEQLTPDERLRIGAVPDTLMGLSGSRYGFGHSRSYMAAGRHSMMEAFAHAFEAVSTGDKYFEALFPNITRYVRSELGA